MAYIVMTYIVMVYIVMAYMVMAIYSDGGPQRIGAHVHTHACNHIHAHVHAHAHAMPTCMPAHIFCALVYIHVYAMYPHEQSAPRVMRIKK